MRVAFTSTKNALSDTAGRSLVKHSGNFQAVEKCLAILLQYFVLLETANRPSLSLSLFKQILGGFNPILLKISLGIRLTFIFKKCNSQCQAYFCTVDYSSFLQKMIQLN